MAALAAAAEPKEKRKALFKRILLATDFSSASEGAFAHAVAIAKRYGSELFIVNAIPPEPREFVPLDPMPHELNRERTEAEKQMKHWVQDARVKDLTCHAITERGKVWDVLSDVLQRESIDLLVIGTHGRGGFKKLALGSVAEHLLRLAPCPVLTVGPHVSPIPTGSADFREILYATDFGSASAKAFPYALALAQDCRAELVLLRMVQRMPVADISAVAYGPPVYAAQDLTKWQNERRQESEEKLRKLIPRDAMLASEPVYMVGMDFLPKGNLDAAKLYKSELIVMGANRSASPQLASRVPWSVTHEVI